MRLSASINFFDGGELLESCVKQIRPHVDHLSIVTQKISNLGNQASDISREALHSVIKAGLIDDVYDFQPDLRLGGGKNEFMKRKIGIDLAKKSGASHFILMDVDEFYRAEEFRYAKKMIEELLIDFSSVGYTNYYRKPTWRLDVNTVGHISFICKICEETTFEINGPYPIEPVDPTRKYSVQEGFHYLFLPSQVLMHHMTGVRLSIEEKLANSSSNDDPNSISSLREKYSIYPTLHLGLNRLPTGDYASIVETEDYFGLSQLFEP